LISNDNVTTDTMECVFEELDKPFTENEIETCNVMFTLVAMVIRDLLCNIKPF
jgi:hypothetical protein